MLCFFRELIDIDELESMFHDNDDKAQSQQMLDDVKQLLRQSMDPSQIYTYKVSLDSV